jgi:hypothetical protein
MCLGSGSTRGHLRAKGFTYVSREQGIGAERASFTIIICMENDQNVFDGDHHSESPYYHCREKLDISVCPLNINHMKAQLT